MNINYQKYKWPLLLLASMASLNCSAATCNESIAHSTPNSRFTINNDGTITDNNTGLQWMRCTLGQQWDGETCTGTTTSYNWQNALTEAKNTTYAGFDDWYLPNIKELSSIVEVACFEPAINDNIFPNTASSIYWSSSPRSQVSGDAWFVDFQDGIPAPGPFSMGSKFSVRLVRFGE